MSMNLHATESIPEFRIISKMAGIRNWGGSIPIASQLIRDALYHISAVAYMKLVTETSQI